MVELGTDGTVQNPKNRRTFAPAKERQAPTNASDGMRWLCNPSGGGFLCPQEHSKMSFQLLGIFPVTRKAPLTVNLGVLSEVGTPLAWNQRMTDIRDIETGSINQKNWNK